MRNLHGKDKLQYLFDYYKLPFVLICIALYIILYALHAHFTQKEERLYLGFTNVTFSESMSEQLLTDYMQYRDFNVRKEELYSYHDLYLSKTPSDENMEYVFLSNTKVLAAIDSEKLDLVYMNQESLDFFLEKGYLADLSPLVPAGIAAQNTSCYALDLLDTAIFKNTDINDSVFVGIIENSPRKKEAVKYITYLFQ